MEAKFAPNKEQVPIVEGIFTWPSDQPRLIASRCKSCGSISFPKTAGCPNPDCNEKQPEQILLSNRGKLWSYTLVNYPPPEPFRMEPFQPFAIGIIELPEGLRLVGMLTQTQGLEIGMELQMVVEPLYRDQDREYLTYKWKPVGK